MKRALLIAIGVLLVGCGPNVGTFRRAPVIIISIDTLRSDHLPSYGYSKVETPAIDALRQDSILFSHAYSHIPLTLPSHMTLMTGMLPFANGVRDNVGFTLRPDVPTLAEILHAQGYATGAAVSSVVLLKSTGIGRGFDFYDDDIETPSSGASIAAIQRSGFETERLAERWIEAHGSSPFFLFLHLYEPHTPYDPPEPYRSRYRGNLYDGEIATADAIVGKFLAFVKHQDLYSRSLLVLMSDHGEGLGEHGEDEHGVLLYRATLQVPLLLKLPGQKQGGERIDRTVGLVDVFPTVTTLLSLVPPPGLSGQSLLASRPATDSRRIYSESYYGKFHFGWSDLSSLIDERFHYIHAPSDELYDLTRDPAEIADLSRGLPPAFRSMRSALLGMDRPIQRPGASDPEQVKKLAALGYIGSGGPSEAHGPLLNPRDHIGEITDLKRGLHLANEGDPEQAVRLFRSLLARNPDMLDAWAGLATAYDKLGDYKAALSALAEKDRRSPGDPETLASLAAEYLQARDIPNAERSAQRSLAVNGPASAHEVLARVELGRKNFDAAEREARAALNGYGRREEPNLILAEIERGRGNLAAASRILDEIRARLDGSGKPPIQGLEYLRADILARMGQKEDAEALFRDELKRYPRSLEAWTGLTFLLASEGRSDDSRKTIDEMLKASDGPRAFDVAARTMDILGDRAAATRFRARARALDRSEEH